MTTLCFISIISEYLPFNLKLIFFKFHFWFLFPRNYKSTIQIIFNFNTTFQILSHHQGSIGRSLACESRAHYWLSYPRPLNKLNCNCRMCKLYIFLSVFFIIEFINPFIDTVEKYLNYDPNSVYAERIWDNRLVKRNLYGV